MENQIATVDDFKRAAETRRQEPERLERVALPRSGYAVLLRRPTPLWFLFHGHLPVSLAAKQQGGGGDTAARALQGAEEFVEFSKWIVELLSEVFVRPRLSLDPGAEEISPAWLDEDDVNFIIRWAVGEVAAEGSSASGVRDLAEFPKARAAAAPRPGGGSVPLSAEPVAAGDNDGAAD